MGNKRDRSGHAQRGRIWAAAALMLQLSQELCVNDNTRCQR